MATIADGLKDVFLAGVGAMALGAEKTQELVEQLIAKGEITVEQGKEINAEALKRAQTAAQQFEQQAETAAQQFEQQAETAAQQAGSQAQAAAAQARTAAGHMANQAKTASELLKEQGESAISFARSQAEMGADAAKKNAEQFADTLKHDVLEAQMALMTPEQRAEFAAKAAEIAARDK